MKKTRITKKELKRKVTFSIDNVKILETFCEIKKQKGKYIIKFNPIQNLKT